MTKEFTVEVAKTIVVTVEARSYSVACKKIEDQMLNGEHDQSLATGEFKFDLIDEQEVK